MRYLYFLILIAVLIAAAIAVVYFGQQFFAQLESYLAQRLQANLLNLRIKEQEAIINFLKEQPATLLFVGDVMLDRGVATQIKKYQDIRYPFLKIADFLNSADLVFGNLEGPISTRGAKQDKIYSFRFAPEVMGGLKFAGFDILSLANNHIFDWGREALEDTVSILGTNNIKAVGAGRNFSEANEPVIMEINIRRPDLQKLGVNPSINSGLTLSKAERVNIQEIGSPEVKVAFLAYTPFYKGSTEKNFFGLSWFALEEIKKRINQVKNSKTADIIIISFHWGEEYQTRSNSEQQTIARSLIDAGADLIVGHHPHVVQEIEKYPPSPEAASFAEMAMEAESDGQSKNSWIAYSLGNFVFDSRREETTRGLILKAIVKNKKIISVEPIEIKINDSFQPEIIGI